MGKWEREENEGNKDSMIEQVTTGGICILTPLGNSRTYYVSNRHPRGQEAELFISWIDSYAPYNIKSLTLLACHIQA